MLPTFFVFGLLPTFFAFEIPPSHTKSLLLCYKNIWDSSVTFANIDIAVLMAKICPNFANSWMAIRHREIAGIQWVSFSLTAREGIPLLHLEVFSTVFKCIGLCHTIRQVVSMCWNGACSAVSMYWFTQQWTHSNNMSTCTTSPFTKFKILIQQIGSCDTIFSTSNLKLSTFWTKLLEILSGQIYDTMNDTTATALIKWWESFH